MVSTLATQTVTRQIWDGSYVLVCLQCFAIIGNASKIVRLDDGENVHICEQSFLAERGLFTRRRVH
jgi:hypothetical protein